MLLKCCTHYASEFGKVNSGHRTRKGQFSFQSQRKAIPMNVQITIHTTALISQASKIMLKILQARLQQSMNQELLNVQAGFRKGRGMRDQIANICWIIEINKGNPPKIYFCFIDYTKAFDFVDHNKLWKILNEMGIPHYLPPEKPVCKTRSNS